MAKVTLLITAFKEPETIGEAIAKARAQTYTDHEIIVSAPDRETQDVVIEHATKDPRVKLFVDPGKGKSFALNMIFEDIETDILVLTDGDVHLKEDALEKILRVFKDKNIGLVTGRPIPLESRKEKWGYYAHFLFDGAHLLREQARRRGGFIEGSGYLFALRKEHLQKIPLDVAEDTFLPYRVWERGQKIGYAKEAHVYVQNVDNWGDWIKQKVRTAKAHETLEKYVDTQKTRRVKSFQTEALKGVGHLIRHPKNLKEYVWAMQLAIKRAQMWGIVYKETKVENKHYQDNWERIESTKKNY